MNKFTAYTAAAALAAAALSACRDNWGQPPVSVPEFPEGTKANTTIAALKAEYWQDQDSYGTLIGLDANGDSVVIVGTIISNTNPGNIYKSLVVQDATGGITIGLDTTAVSAAFPQGSAIAINVTGMCIGRYNGLAQLGDLVGSGVNRMSTASFRPRIKLDYFGGQMDTTITTIGALNAVARDKDAKIEWQSRLVRINKVKFVEQGEPFTNGNTTSRYIIDDEGNKMIVYNSSYATFAYDALPYGHGDVVAVLSCYKDSWQLLLNDLNGLIDFDGEGAPDPNLTTILSEPFSASQGAFTIEDILLGEGLTYVWQFDSKYGMKASAYSGKSIESDSWLVSPEVNLEGYTSPVLTFSHCVNKFEGTTYTTQATLAVRVVGEQTEWQDVTIPVYSSNADWNFVDSGDIDLSAFAGKKIQFAFHYTSTNTASGTWEIKNIKLSAIKNQ